MGHLDRKTGLASKRVVGGGSGAEPPQRFIRAATERSGRPQAKPEVDSAARSGTDGSPWENTIPSLRRRSGGAVSAAKPRQGRLFGKTGFRWKKGLI